jgi:hypothetical protein
MALPPAFATLFSFTEKYTISSFTSLPLSTNTIVLENEPSARSLSLPNFPKTISSIIGSSNIPETVFLLP